MTKRKEFSEEQVAEICRLYVEDGLLSKDIAKLYNTYYAKITKILNANGIKTKSTLDIKQGDRFNQLVVLEEIEKEGNRRRFLCQCDCGNYTNVRINNLRSGAVKSCGKCRGEYVIGNRYGRIVVINEVSKDKHGFRRVIGECDCGKIKEYDLSVLRRGIVISCGCYQRELMRDKVENAIGNKYGRLTVVSNSDRRNKSGQRYVWCICSCDGNIGEYVLSSIKRGRYVSCGCLKKEITSKLFLNSGVDYTGQTFGRLTILYEVERAKNNNRQVMAQCSCDGNIDKYILHGLVSGRTMSCGCYSRERIKETRTQQVKDYQERHPLFCEVEEIMDDPDGYGILTRCKYSDCRKWFKPRRDDLTNRIVAIEKPTSFSLGTENNLYCSDKCKHSCILYDLRKDPYEIKDEQELPWTTYELSIFSDEVKFRQLAEIGKNKCELCDNEEGPFHAHHSIPKKMEWIFALDPDNGIIVCEKCHYEKMHTGSCSLSELRKLVCPK